MKKDLNGSKLFIKISDGINGSFGTIINGSTSIILGRQLDSSQLLHEMMHAHRAYRETVTTYNASSLNGEIEAHYAQQIFLNSLPGYKGSKLESQQLNDNRRESIANLNKIIDNKGNLRENMTNIELEKQIKEVVKIFKSSKTYANYSYDESRTPLSNFNNLRTLTKDCP